MVEAVDKVAEEHERNTRLVILLLGGLRSLDAGPGDPAAVAESFVLKLLSVSGFHPSLTACAVCGAQAPRLWSAGLGGAVCPGCADRGAGAVHPEALELLAHLARVDLSEAGELTLSEPRIRREARGLLFGFTEYHLERRMKSVPMLVRTAP
jgi:DNA repair protein RecO (recombination protein O)